MIPELIKYFKVVAVAPNATLLDAAEVNKYAMKCGYLVYPEACTADVVTFLRTQKANLNSTFYKKWGDVERLSELQMRVLQILHYMSTYGTDFQGKTFVMNDQPDELQFHNFTIIRACTERELLKRIGQMLRSGIAIGQETLNLLIEQLKEFYEDYGWTLDIDSLENREAMAMLCEIYDELPKGPMQLLRYLVYKCTNSALLIKNDRSFRTIANSEFDVAAVLSDLSDEQLIGLASIFYRFKPLMLAFRQNAKAHGHKEGVARINEIRRLARKYHKPFKAAPLEDIPGNEADDVLKAINKEKSAFKLIRILNYLISHDKPLRTFFIRNGKVFVKEGAPKRPLINLKEIKKGVLKKVVSYLRAKATTADGKPLTVRFPRGIELAAPVSERLFVGAVPYGSRYRLSTNNLVGIYWRNEWGTHDFDLQLVGQNGIRLGWNTMHKDENLLFSGDMTDANPEATEIFYSRGAFPNCTIRVNRFNGEEGSKFRIFFAQNEVEGLPQNYMVEADDIRFQEDLTSIEKETTVAVVYKNKVYFSAVSSGNGRLPNEHVSFEEAFAKRFEGFALLKPLMLVAGFKEFEPEDGAKPDIDLSELEKDTLIKLFS